MTGPLSMGRHFRTALVLALTVGLLAFFFRSADPQRVWEAITSAHPGLLLLSLACSVITYGVRAERWRYLLRPVGHVRLSSATRAMIIGFAVNSILPGRVGEVVRPYVLSRHEAVATSAGFATIVLERLLDLLAVVMVVVIGVLVFDPPSQDPALMGTIRTGVALTGVLGVLVVLAVMVVVRRPEGAERVLGAMARRIPRDWGERVLETVLRFLSGFAVLRHPAALVVPVLMSLVLWGGIGTGVWAASRAFDIQMPFGGGAVMVGLMAMGVSIPTPAGAGGFHALFQLGVMSLYGAGTDQAVAAGVVNHIITFGPITIVGLVLMGQEGLKLSALGHLEASGHDVPTSVEPPGAGGAPSGLPGPAPVENERGLP